jgi:5'/3'-nucleotidase SurE
LLICFNTRYGEDINIEEHMPGVWSIGGTPVDCILAGLGLVMKDDPPDLVISGANRGENLGMVGTMASGTIGAALRATHFGASVIKSSSVARMALKLYSPMYYRRIWLWHFYFAPTRA